MKILILANNDIGLYKFRKELLENLVKEHEVYACLPNGDMISQIENIGVKFIQDEFDRHGTNPISEIKHYLRYKSILKDINPDIVFTYTIKPNIYGGMACKSLKIPYVANITGLGTAVENPGFMQKLTLTLYRKALKNAQKVFFQNKENQEFMLSHNVINGDYDLLPGSGVNLEQYKPLEYPNDDTVEFVFVARLMKEKGIEQYLEAASYIRQKYDNTRFHICGACEEDYKERLEQLQKDGVVIYHGVVKDMLSIYKNVHCTVHPTYYPEGLSNVLLESSACARPIITTDRSGCREVIDDGVNGFIVKQRDSEDLIKQIEKFLALSNEERELMGRNGRAKVEREFDRNIVVRKYLNEINEE